VGDNSWTQSACRPDVWIYGVPNQGAYAWTATRGSIWVTGGIYQAWKSQGFECGLAGPPAKPSGWIQEMNYGQGCVGQWFTNAAIGYHDGAWRIMYGYYGQLGLVARVVSKVRRKSRAKEPVLLRAKPNEWPAMPAPPVPILRAEMKAQIAG
jgi:hypothetical protein